MPLKRVVRRRVVRRRAPVKTTMKALMSMMRKPRARVGGRRKTVVSRRSGRGWLDSLKSGFNTVKDFVKSNQLISKGIRMIPGKYSAPAADLASALGYGRKRVARRPRVGGMRLSPPFMGGMKRRTMSMGGRKTVGVVSNLSRRVGGRVVFPAVYTTGLGGLSATTA